ncbi:hypothetical protein MCNF_08720 [Mycolicibacterium confluentis]|uniref:Uncharacterized protein n=1 Tax=Mycolicibacterium confluentis TaxID=28047 RepID=A0A7I7XSL4_9MYCO|nr:hypothetical protein MCNF_08720 [Mycolicibacterium confluentis]
MISRRSLPGTVIRINGPWSGYIPQGSTSAGLSTAENNGGRRINDHHHPENLLNPYKEDNQGRSDPGGDSD